MKKSKPTDEETTTVGALGKIKFGVGGWRIGSSCGVDVPMLVSNAAVVVAGRITVVVENVVLEIAATEVGGTVVVPAEGTVVMVVVELVEGTAMAVVEVLVEGTTVVTDEEFVEEAIFARRFFKKVMSSSLEIFCAKKMTQMMEMMLKFMVMELQMQVWSLK